MHMHTHIAHVHAHACTCMHMDSSSTRALHRGLHMHMPMPCILPLGFGPVVPPPHRSPAAPTPATPNPPPPQPSATPSPATPIPLQWLHWINGFNGSSNDYRLSINVYSSRVRPCAHPCTPSRSKSTSTASHCVLRRYRAMLFCLREPHVSAADCQRMSHPEVEVFVSHEASAKPERRMLSRE